jgi:hypothetical protein
VRRGFKCNIAPISYNQAPAWTLHIKATTERHVGGRTATDRPRLTLDSNVPGEKVWCLETDTGTLITRRNGKVAIMGNCQMVGRGLRLWPGKSDCIVLDVVGATGRHRLAAPIELWGEQGVELEDAPAVLEGGDLEALDDAEEQAEIDHLLGLDEAPTYRDGKLVTEVVDLFEGSDAGWLRTYAGVWFLAAPERYVAVLPRVDGGYVVVTLHRTRSGDSRWVMERCSELSYAMAHATGDVTDAERDAMGGTGRAQFVVGLGFRHASPRAEARRIGFPVPDDATPGEIRKMLTVAYASARIDNALPAWVRR